MSLYEDLGINKNATTEEIKVVYKKLALQHHPDKGGNSETFKKISHAYSILGDAEKRKEYDNPNQGLMMHNPFSHNSPFDNSAFNFNDIFANMHKMHMQNMGGFHMNFNNQSNENNNMIHHTLKISKSEHQQGVNKTFTVNIPKKCDNCVKICETCKGSGMQETIQQGPGFIHKSVSFCQSCNRTGYNNVLDNCSTCQNRKNIDRHVTLGFDIPANFNIHHIIQHQLNIENKTHILQIRIVVE